MLYRKILPSLLLAHLALVSCNSTRPLTESSTSRVPAPIDLSISAEAMALGIRRGDFTSEAVVSEILARIEAVDRSGPTLNSILSLNPDAIVEARRRDAQASSGDWAGALHGVPILVKDSIETRELPTTAGSLALSANDTGRDAPLIARLRGEGAIILGKTNLSEWSNFRSNNARAGWSAVGGQTRSAVAPNLSPCGSSSGSAVAVAAWFAPISLGVETNGSITCPAAWNGVVGMKPTVGLVSRTHIVPISRSQDSPGILTRTVRDAAISLSVMAGTDAADPATATADDRKTNYIDGIEGGVRGMRIGVFRWAEGGDKFVSSQFNTALAALQRQGAILVDITQFEPDPVLWRDGELLLQIEFRAGIDAYLRTASQAVGIETLSELIAFNRRFENDELVPFDQSIFDAAAAAPSIDSDSYRRMAASIRNAAGPDGIDKLLNMHDVEVLVMPTAALPRPIISSEVPRERAPPIGATWLPAMAGYPALSVPISNKSDQPVGLFITGTAWDDATILRVGRAVESAVRR